MRARTFITLLLVVVAGCGDPATAPPGVTPPVTSPVPSTVTPTAPPDAVEAVRTPRERRPVATPAEDPTVERPADPEVGLLLDDVLGADPDARTKALQDLREHPAGVLALAWVLENGSPEARLLAARSLQRLGAAALPALPSLMRVARAGDHDARMAVILVLGAVGDERALPVLTDLLDDPDANIVRRAVDALGFYGARAKPALPALVALLGQEEGYVGRSAADAIGSLGPDGAPAVPALIAQFDAEEGAGSMSLIKALTAIGPDAREAIPALVREIVRHEQRKEEVASEHPTMHVQWEPISIYAEDALVAMGEPAIRHLITMLGHEMRHVRRRGVSALQELGAPAREAALAALGDANAHRRQHAVEVLAKIAADDEEVFERVAALLADPDDWVRIRTTGELHRFGPRAVPYLIRAVSDGQERWAAAGSLAHLGPAAAPAVPVLEHALAAESNPLRRHAASALGTIGPAAAGAAAALGRLLDDEQEDVREAASGALRRIGPAAVPVLLAAMERGSDRARAGAATALAGMQDGSAAVTDALLSALDAQDADVRRRAAVAVARTGRHAEVVLPALREGLQFSIAESDLEVSERLAEVALAIHGYGSDGAVALPDLIESLRRFRLWSFPRGSEPGWAREELATVKRVIARFGEYDPDPIAALLSDEDDYMRNVGRDVLVLLGPTMIPRLAQVARGGEPSAQVTAIEGLGSLAGEHEQARAEIVALMQMDGDARRCQAAKSYYHLSGDVELVVPILLDLVRNSDDVDARGSAAAFLGFNIKEQAAFAIKEIRELHAAATDADTRRRLGHAIEAIENR